MDETITPIVEAAISIILSAGDAREDNLLAIEAMSNFDLKSARENIEKAEKKIADAHKTQTDQIQDEVRGRKSEYSLLFAHAQDTMMTINSEILLTKSFMKVFVSMYEKIEELKR